nr:MAG TPA: hypothetical protein [Caudoviricetes sp.]
MLLRQSSIRLSLLRTQLHLRIHCKLVMVVLSTDKVLLLGIFLENIPQKW